LAEVGGVGWRERRGGGAGDDGENFGFGGKAEEEVDTVGTTESVEFGNAVWKVNVVKAGAGVTEAGETDQGGGGSPARVVAWVARDVLRFLGGTSS
jgi:hypothetical protein